MDSSERKHVQVALLYRSRNLNLLGNYTANNLTRVVRVVAEMQLSQIRIRTDKNLTSINNKQNFYIQQKILS